MILLLTHNIENASTMIKSAQLLSQKLDRTAAIIAYTADSKERDAIEKQCRNWFKQRNEEPMPIHIYTTPASQLVNHCEQLEAAFLFIQTTDTKKSSLRRHLCHCRELRIPYIFFKEEFPALNPERLLVPVRFLPEDYEKAQFAAAFGRFYNTQITVLQANDYGSRAATTVYKIEQFFSKFDFSNQIEKAEKDSYKLYKEALRRAENDDFDLVILSASREYGLDDILFGAPELHHIRRSTRPLLLINPRGDLYTLCE